MKTFLGQMVKFGIVGLSNVLLDTLVYIGLTRGFAWFFEHYLAAAFLAFVIAGINSFFWNKHWTFQHRLAFHHSQLLKFYLVAGFVVMINASVLWFLVEQGFYDIFAKVAASCTAGGMNFLLQKFWTFRHSPGVLAKPVKLRKEIS